MTHPLSDVPADEPGIEIKEIPTTQHLAFARALVALAREHNMTGIYARFHPSFTGSRRIGNSLTVEVSWNEGRHGDNNSIVVNFQANATIPEKKQ